MGRRFVVRLVQGGGEALALDYRDLEHRKFGVIGFYTQFDRFARFDVESGGKIGSQKKHTALLNFLDAGFGTRDRRDAFHHGRVR